MRMNKEEFLNELERELSILNDKERQDIIGEYRDTIEEKVKHGQTEEEAVKDFGDLDELVSGILEAYKINPKYNYKEEGSFSKITEEGEKLIKRGANKLADMTREFANNIKDNDTEMNLNLAFEIIIKIFFTLIVLALMTVPFRIFKDLGFSFADTFFSPLSGLVKVFILILFVALYFGISLLVIIALFKQYFKKEGVKDGNELAADTEDKKEIKKETKEKTNNERPVKIIHKNGPTVGSVLLLMLKIWIVIFVLFPLFCVDIAAVLGLFLSIFYWIKGINLLGLTLLLLGISAMFIWFTILVFNLVFSKGKTTIIPFFIGLIVTVFGTFFFVDMVTNIKYIDEPPVSNELETVEKEFTTDSNVYIDYQLNGNISQKIDDKLADNTFRLKITYDEDAVDVNIYNEENYTFPSDECAYSVDKHKCEQTYNYISLDYTYIDNYNSEKQRYNDFIDNLKDNKIYNYSKLSEVNVEIIANSKTMSLIESNTTIDEKL